MRFISISNTVTALGQTTDANTAMNHNILGAIRQQTPRSESGLIWKSGFESRITVG